MVDFDEGPMWAGIRWFRKKHFVEDLSITSSALQRWGLKSECPKDLQEHRAVDVGIVEFQFIPGHGSVSRGNPTVVARGSNGIG